MGLTLSGKKAVVSGGSRGIGFAIAEAFLREDMEVAILGRNPSNLEKASASLLAEGLRGYSVHKCDLLHLEEIRSTVGKIGTAFGRIDVLVNSAGVLDKTQISSITEQEWDCVLDINLKGTFFMIQAALPFLKNSLAGRVINIASNAGRMGGYENGLAYTASKGGVIALTYGAARRLAGDNITVNCIAPGTIKTDMSQSYDEAAHKRLLARFPIGRLGRIEEIPAAALYFASNESSFTTGAVLDINGGMFTG